MITKLKDLFNQIDRVVVIRENLKNGSKVFEELTVSKKFTRKARYWDYYYIKVLLDEEYVFNVEKKFSMRLAFIDKNDEVVFLFKESRFNYPGKYYLFKEIILNGRE